MYIVYEYNINEHYYINKTLSKYDIHYWTSTFYEWWDILYIYIIMPTLHNHLAPFSTSKYSKAAKIYLYGKCKYTVIIVQL